MQNDFEDMMEGGDVLPPTNRVRRAYIYYVILKEEDGKHEIKKFTEQDGGRAAAKRFVNDVGIEAVHEVIKVSEVINVKVKTKVTVHF